MRKNIIVMCAGLVSVLAFGLLYGFSLSAYYDGFGTSFEASRDYLVLLMLSMLFAFWAIARVIMAEKGDSSQPEAYYILLLCGTIGFAYFMASGIKSAVGLSFAPSVIKFLISLLGACLGLYGYELYRERKSNQIR